MSSATDGNVAVRPNRQPKESTALLMSVIRSILGSESSEHRDKEKAKLEKGFQRSDQRLDELIAGHHQNLTAVMQAFSKVSSRLTTSKEKIRIIKDNLENCKMLLNCKRDELKKLWLKGIEHKHILFLMQQIATLKDSPDRVERYVVKKHYLHATELLVTSVNALTGDLDGVEALYEVKQELQAKNNQLYKMLVESLHHHLYVRSISDICVVGNQQSVAHVDPPDVNHDSNHKSTDPKLKVKVTPFRGSREKTIMSPHNYSAIMPTSPASSNEEKVMEDLLLSDPEEDSGHFIAILVECLSLLNKIPEAVETIKYRMQKELCTVVKHTCQHLLADQGDGPVDNPHMLLHMLEIVCKKFSLISQAHEHVLSNFKRVVRKSDIHSDVKLYDMSEFWSKVQAVLQIVLIEHLDIENAASGQHAAAFDESSVDIASYFAKKKPVRPKKSLFKFDSSSHAISFNSYLSEQHAMYASEEALHSLNEALHVDMKVLVCKPDAKNITVIFNHLMRFVDEMEQRMGCAEGARCTLHSFITDFVRNAFIIRVQTDVMNSISAATKSVNAWRASASMMEQKPLDSPRQLMQSTVCVEQHIQDLRELMQDIPEHAEIFLNMICNILVFYKETCQAAYRGIVQPESTDKRVISASWAKDEDVTRFLRSLPNWINLQNPPASGKEDFESHEEVRLRNKKESEILTGNLGDTLIPQHEILSDVTQLGVLALMHESLEWFDRRVKAVAKNLPTASNAQNSVTGIPPVSASSVESICQLAQQFADLSHTCLLVLHLEVRLHCFYYLLPVAKQASFAITTDSQEPDPEIVKLNKDLASMEEVMSVSLQPRKLKYVFEGLGHLMASIIINSAQYIKRINENGVKRMCRNIFAIQQNLTNITLAREVTLDHARRYFELLYHPPEKILNMVMEDRPTFTELEYVNALQLLHRSQPDNEESRLQLHLKRLRDILNEVAIVI